MNLGPEELLGNRYRLLEIIGRGGSSEVWRARDQELDRTVAVKLLRIWNAEHKARVWREARLAALLDESVAVPVYDFGEADDHSFLVMELVDEPTLRDLMNEGREWGSPELIELAVALFSSLARAHELSVVHRDIKPENIFVREHAGSWRCRFVDFGLAFLSGQEKGALGRITSKEGLSGTPAYLSPEQARRCAVGSESDLYSTGCVLYELATGVLPFQGAVGELLSKHIYLPAIPVGERNPELDPRFAALVDALLDKEPEMRPTAVAALATLRGCVDSVAEVEETRGERRREGATTRSREERMVSAPEGELAESPTLELGACEEVPAWLESSLQRFELVRLVDGREASVLLVPADGPRDWEEDGILRLAYWQGGESAFLGELIRSGVVGVVTPTMGREALAKLLRRVARQAASTMRSS